MNNFPYRNKPVVPLAVALRSLLVKTEGKIVTAPPAERERLRQRAKVLRELLTPSSATLLPTLPNAPQRQAGSLVNQTAFELFRHDLGQPPGRPQKGSGRTLGRLHRFGGSPLRLLILPGPAHAVRRWR